MRFVFIMLISTALFGVPLGPNRVVDSGKKMLVIKKGNYKSFFVTAIDKPIPVKSFKLDETAVTNLEFLEFVKSNPEWRRSKVNRLFADKNYLSHWETDLSIGKSKQMIYNSPVVNVSWFAAQAYSKWQNKRLPTVSEWEFAGLGTPKNIKQSSLTDYILDWYKKPNLKVLPNIKSTYQNDYGLYDMHGLIWEWTFNFNSYIASADSRGGNSDEQKLFCAAGSLNVADKKDYAGYLRFSYRGSLKGNYCIANLGFRCAKNIN